MGTHLLAVSVVTATLISAGVGLAGGLLSSGLAEYLRTHRDRDTEGLRLRAAARLVDEELRNAHDAAEKILEGEPFAALPVMAWDREAVRLAATLNPREWQAVAAAYDRIRGYNWRLEAGVLESHPDQRSAICEKIVAASTEARKALPKYV